MKKTILAMALAMVCILAMIPMAGMSAFAANDITAKFTDANFKAEVYRLINKTPGSIIYDTDVAGIKELDLSGGYDELRMGGMEISVLDGIEYFTSLEYLDCSNNQLASLDVSNNTELIGLNCFYTILKELDVTNNAKLVYLYCKKTKFKSLDLSKNTELKYLDISNQIESLDLSKNTKLTHLDCSASKLTSLDISKNTELIELYCGHNQIAKLDVSNNIKLITLVCHYNKMESPSDLKGVNKNRTKVQFTPQFDNENGNRYYGDDRIATAIEASKAGWTTSQNVILASSSSFADALVGGPLAKMLDAPILLTKGTTSNLESIVLSRISELGATNIYILGGESAISAGIYDQLKSAGYNVERIFGNDRYETSNAIAGKMDIIRGKAADFAFVASGVNFPDALSAAPVAADKEAPILFANKDGQLPSSSTGYIKNKEINNAVLLGGEGIVKNLDASINVTTKRIAGEDRYETSAKIYNEYKDSFNGQTVVVATGRNFPDALSGGALAAKTDAPVLLINGTGAGSQPVKAALDDLSPDRVYILGGESAINSDNVKWYVLD